MYKRLLIAILTGAILGIICILGANLRFDGTLSRTFLFAFWFNRFLMGVTIGLVMTETSMLSRIIRGAALGLLVSFGFFAATDFLDVTGFLVGAVYGIIIELVAYYFSRPRINRTEEED